MRYRLVLVSIGLVTAGALLVAGIEGEPVLLLAGATVAALFVALAMMSARVQLFEDSVRIRVAGLFSTDVPYRDITGVSIGPRTGLLHGMGLRILPAGGTGYLVGGPSVRIRCGNTTVLVSCAEPEKMIELLNRQGS